MSIDIEDNNINHHSIILQIFTKISLATGGIVIVLLSILCSLGLFGYAGMATTMLVIEVDLQYLILDL